MQGFGLFGFRVSFRVLGLSFGMVYGLRSRTGDPNKLKTSISVHKASMAGRLGLPFSNSFRAPATCALIGHPIRVRSSDFVCGLRFRSWSSYKLRPCICVH